MEILIILMMFMALLLIVIWLPYFKQVKNEALNTASTHQESSRKETNISLYKEHKAEIEKDFSEGAIDEESYQYLLAELDQSLLQDIEASEEVLDNLQEARKEKEHSFSVVWPIALTLFITIFSFSLYNTEGAFDNLTQTPAVESPANQQAAMDARRDQMINYLEELRQKVESEPDDTEAWYAIGQTLVSVGMFDAAINAYQQVIRIEGESADLLGLIAQAHYYKNNQQMDETVQSFIDQALKLNPNDPATNILVGMHNFINQQYQPAIDAWQRVLNSNQVGVNTKALIEAVDEAKKRLALTASSGSSGAAEQSTNSEVEQEVNAVSGPQIKLQVSLSPKVEKIITQQGDRVVFIYAIPTDGRRMPLAAVKLNTSDLPLTITLSDKDAMTPQSALSSVKSVNINAVASKQGGAGIKPGDYKAQAFNIDVESQETLNLIIDTLVQ
ncbi:MAG: c-type cytochrome biogenesis protein CcmI [Colwellia sp.]